MIKKTKTKVINHSNNPNLIKIHKINKMKKNNKKNSNNKRNSHLKKKMKINSLKIKK